MLVLRPAWARVRKVDGGTAVIVDGVLLQDDKWSLRYGARNFLRAAQSLRRQIKYERDQEYRAMCVQAVRRRIAAAMALRRRSNG